MENRNVGNEHGKLRAYRKQHNDKSNLNDNLYFKDKWIKLSNKKNGIHYLFMIKTLKKIGIRGNIST